MKLIGFQHTFQTNEIFLFRQKIQRQRSFQIFSTNFVAPWVYVITGKVTVAAGFGYIIHEYN